MKYAARVMMPEILPGFAHSLPCIRLRRKNDYDGELRQLSIEAALAVDGKVWSEETVEVLNDMYSVSCPVNLYLKI